MNPENVNGIIDETTEKLVQRRDELRKEINGFEDILNKRDVIKEILEIDEHLAALSAGETSLNIEKREKIREFIKEWESIWKWIAYPPSYKE